MPGQCINKKSSASKILDKAKRTVKPKDSKLTKSEPSTKATVIRYGADFAGVGTVSYALRATIGDTTPPITVKHMFSCDNNMLCKQIDLNGPFRPLEYLDNITFRPDEPESKYINLGLYMTSPPCQGISPAGLQDLNDPRTKLLDHSLKFIEYNKPRAWILENSHCLIEWKKFEDLKDSIVARVALAGYTVKYAVLNSKCWVPQNRPRCYMVGVHNSCLRNGKGSSNVPWFPEEPSSRRFELTNDIIETLPPSEFQTLPPQASYRKAVEKAMVAVATGQGAINPFSTHVIVDMHASDRFSAHQINCCPSITHSRGGSFGYWDTKKGGKLTLEEMAQLQGFSKEDVRNWRRCNVTDGQLGRMVGNAQTCTLLADLVPHVLYHGSMINLGQFKQMKENAAKMHS